MALLVQSSGRRAIVLEVQMPTIQTSMRSATKTTSPAGLGHPVRLPPRHSAIIASMMANRWLPLVVWSGLCFIWGSTWLAIKVGLNDLPPLTFAGIRFVIAAVMLFAIILIRRIRLPATAADWRILAWTGFLNITVNYALVFWGEQYLASGLAALLNATVPLFGLPLAHRYIASERLTARRISGVLLGLAGVAIVCSAELGGNGTHAFWASVAIIVASLAGAQGSVLVKAKGGHLHPIVARRHSSRGESCRVPLDHASIRGARVSRGGGIGRRLSGVLLADQAHRGHERVTDPAGHATGSGAPGCDVARGEDRVGHRCRWIGHSCRGGPGRVCRNGAHGDLASPDMKNNEGPASAGPSAGGELLY
jgi:hypothetical protein